MCDEMMKLRRWLDKNNIEWRDDSDRFASTWMDRTKFIVGGKEFSVINGVGSYGGAVGLNIKNQGLLELMIDRNEPEGWLTFDDVIKEIENVLKQEN